MAMHASILMNAARLVNFSFVRNKLQQCSYSAAKYFGFVERDSTRQIHSSPSMASYKDVDFNELKDLLRDSKYVVIDVREKEELDESGRIEGAQHIPLGEVTQALQLGPSEFEAKYGFPKPQSDSKIVFSCRSGKRSANACELAKKVGFNNLLNYKGGFLDWSEQTKAK